MSGSHVRRISGSGEIGNMPTSPTIRTDAELLRASTKQIAKWYRELLVYVRSLPEDVQWMHGQTIRRYIAAHRTVRESR